MAGEDLRSHGIDIDHEMSKIQFGDNSTSPPGPQHNDQITTIHNVSLPNTPRGSRWDVHLSQTHISRISPSQVQSSPSPSPSTPQILQGNGAFLAPSLCHPHVHLDKAFLLSHPKYTHLQISRGDFAEAMQLTGQAKALFTQDDLLERGRRLLDESLRAGVTHLRAFVEVDAGVGAKCLDAAGRLQGEYRGKCVVQLCAFAQLPLFSPAPGDENGSVIRGLMREAVTREGVDVIGSTPYVEEERAEMERNIEWMIDLAIEFDKHLDFHLDYNLEPDTEPMVWTVVSLLRSKDWNDKTNRTVVLGHCTRLTLFAAEEWDRLRQEIGDLRVSFVGLPTSDLFMMRTPGRTRGTLNVPELIKDHRLNACIGINNIGNAFTPQGSCDPLTLACSGVGIYQASTGEDCELLYECVSTRARAAIGLGDPRSEDDFSHTAVAGKEADLILFGAERVAWRTRQTIPEVVQLYDHVANRKTLFQGRLVDCPRE